MFPFSFWYDVRQKLMPRYLVDFKGPHHFITGMLTELQGIQNHRRLNSLLSSLFRSTKRKYQSSTLVDICDENPQMTDESRTLYGKRFHVIRSYCLCCEFLCNHFTNVRNVSLALACYVHSFTLPDNICWTRYVNTDSTLLPSWGTMCPKPDIVIVTQRRFGLIQQIPIHNIFI